MKRKITINGIEFEITKEGYETYKEMEKDRLRSKYLQKLDAAHELSSLEFLMESGREQYLEDKRSCVEDEVIKKLMLEKMAWALDRLTEEELHLINQAFLKELSHDEIGRQLHIAQSTVSRNIKRIVDKLRNLMEE